MIRSVGFLVTTSRKSPVMTHQARMGAALYPPCRLPAKSKPGSGVFWQPEILSKTSCKTEYLSLAGLRSDAMTARRTNDRETNER